MYQSDFKEKPPVAKEVLSVSEIHGHKREDYYKWLQERDDPAVMNYIESENNYFDGIMKKFAELTGLLYDEMKSRISGSDSSAPVKDGIYEYYFRYEDGLSYPIYCRKSGGGEEEVILDQNLLARGSKFCAIGSLRVSDDHKYLLYSVDFSGNEIFEIRVKNLIEGFELDDIISETSGECLWANDGRSFFYTALDETHRPCRLFSHSLGTLQERDVQLYYEENQSFFLGIERSRSREYLFLIMASQDTSFVKYINLNDPSSDIMPLVEQVKGKEYYPEHRPGYFYLRTNDEAPNFRIVVSADSAPFEWSDFVPHSQDALIEHVEAFERFLVVKQRRNAAFEIHIFDSSAKRIASIPLPDPYASLDLMGNRVFAAGDIRFSCESFVMPPTAFDYNVDSGDLKVVKRKNIPNYDESLYESTRLFVKSHDDVMVPVTLVHKKGVGAGDESPLFLIGYGAYGYSYDPSFSISLLSLIDRGFVCGIAHIRGGEEMGRQWYLDGKFFKKKNTFFDFISCCEYLISEKWTVKEKLVVSGRSAGGLLMGAVATMRPDLFSIVVAEVPFVDTLNTMLDETLPLTVGEYDEWGNPNRKEFYDYMLSYSPYDNIRHISYPSMFFFTALNDTRVMYWEPLKFVAKLRKYKTDENLLLLKTDCSSGHRGASGRYDSIQEKAVQYSFVLNNIDWRKP